MASVGKDCVEHKGASKGLSDMEDEEDLFEINLKAVNSIPPPHYWESYFTATGSALLANCLLPIADVSSAVPTASKACNALLLPGMSNVFMLAEPMPLENFLQFHTGGLLGYGTWKRAYNPN